MKPETKVGLLFLVTVVMVVVFAYLLGAINPFSSTHELNLAYNFAGGVEVGSPVRVMGIKVGKVKSIDFRPDMKMENGEEVKLVLKVAIDQSAWSTFFINLAGVIGEKFIEVTPGSTAAGQFKPGDLVRGEDPPRIDQLISQSYGLAGKIIAFVEKNEGSVVETIETMNKLVVNLNSLLKTVDSVAGKKDMAKLIQNLVQITGDLSFYSEKLRGPEGEKTMALINKLIWRLEGLDGPAIKKFLQEEGIKAKLF